MKQTAVEWLIEQLTEIHPKTFEQAKAIEKEQIMNAYWDGGQDVPIHVSTCKKYYEETFKSE
jgi:hypothetical protein